MNILVALSRFPYPTDKGDKLRAFYQIKELSKKHTIFLLCLSDEVVSEQHVSKLKAYCTEIKIIGLNKKHIYLNLFSSLFNKAPFQVNYFKNSEMRMIMSQWIYKFNIDIVYVQLIRLVENLPFEEDVPFFLDYMDALSEGMYKRIKFSNFYQKPFVRIEAKRLKRYEINAGRLFQGHSIITNQDAEFLPKSVQKNMSIIPNGVNEYYLAAAERLNKKYDLIFTGNMGYHPNIVAAQFIVQNVLPLLALKGLNLSVCLAGTSPAADVLKLKSDQVCVTGFVEDIKPYILESRMFVAPLLSGSGLQNKLLEAMACGLPSITTSLANKALGAVHGHQIYIADTAQEFADRIEYVLKNELVAEKIGNEGKEFIKRHFDWSQTTVLLEQAFEKVVEKRVEINQ
ncbi:glycosyltransferase [Cytophaga aurantiaca]|uniref:glycosyltransferase n=1 Tax=Cytophaga aurantiaca TaxID=29530 RepID=UPI000365DF71|nr:glycosyltransferase [Cytophaga aurantiaca]